MQVRKFARIQFHQPNALNQTMVLAPANSTTLIYQPGEGKLTVKTALGESTYDVLPNYSITVSVELAEMPDGA